MLTSICSLTLSKTNVNMGKNMSKFRVVLSNCLLSRRPHWYSAVFLRSHTHLSMITWKRNASCSQNFKPSKLTSVGMAMLRPPYQQRVSFHDTWLCSRLRGRHTCTFSEGRHSFIISEGRHSSTLAELSSTSQLFYRILESFPEGIQMAFAYGSGVYHQEGHVDMQQNMLDFIIVVDDPQAWHIANLKRNRHHYSFLKYLGGRGVTYMQEYGAGVYFNTLVPFEDRMIKYGVVGTERLIVDLLDWDTLYVSGRLHKPVKLVLLPTNPDLKQAMQVNLESAVHAALLLLPEDFCEEVLYLTIAGLSYNGDFRMVVGEDRNKVANIVRPNMAHFRQLYGSILQAEEHVQWHPQQSRLEQNPNHITQFHHLQLLPKTVLLLLQENRTRPGSHPDLEEVLKIYANSSHCDDTVARCISHIVWRSSIVQSAKTVLSAGTKKSIVYSFKKLRKMLKGKPKADVHV